MTQRKLFSFSKSFSCADLCGSTCDHGCYSYSTSYPVLPPPPPPLPPSLSGHNPHFSTIALIIISLFGSCCLLFALITAKRCCNCTRFRPHQRRTIAATTNDHDQFLDENPTRIIDHPIWYINTIGLRPSIISSIAIFSYKRGDNLVDLTECSVCLNEFQNGETLRLLPKCNHAFHVACIDTWLRSHVNCPVCRSCIVSNVMAPDPLDSNGVNPSTTTVQDSGSVEENSSNGELNTVNQTRNEVLYPSGVGTEEVLEFSLVRADDQEAEIASNSGDLESVETCKLHDHYLRDINKVKDGNYDILPWRRSVSAMNSTAEKCGECFVHPRQEEHKGFENGQGESSGLQGRICGSPITECLHKNPVRMKRSFSHSGRLILSRQHSTPRRKSPFPL